MHVSGGEHVCTSTGVGECAIDAGYTFDRSLRAIPNGQVSLLTKQGRVVITSPICRTFVDEATVGRDVKDWIARVKRVGLPGVGSPQPPATTQIKSRRRFRLCIIFPSIDGCQCAFALSMYVLGPRYISPRISVKQLIGEFVLETRRARDGLHPFSSRGHGETRSLHIVIKFRIDGCQLVQS